MKLTYFRTVVTATSPNGHKPHTMRVTGMVMCNKPNGATVAKNEATSLIKASFAKTYPDVEFKFTADVTTMPYYFLIDATEQGEGSIFEVSDGKTISIESVSDVDLKPNIDEAVQEALKLQREKFEVEKADAVAQGSKEVAEMKELLESASKKIEESNLYKPQDGEAIKEDMEEVTTNEELQSDERIVENKKTEEVGVVSADESSIINEESTEEQQGAEDLIPLPKSKTSKK